jgi:uncharacterized protein (TIGR03435 family)
MASAGTGWSQPALPAGADPQPVDGIDFVLRAFEKYPIVAIGDLPGCEEFHDFVRALVRTRAFPSKVNDIVVDFGNPLYQPLVDRYVLEGELTPREVLRHVWDDTTESPFLTWDSPVYAEFFDALRAINLNLPKDKRIHLILADAPISWRKIESRQQWLDLRGAAREQALASRIGEILSKQRRALVIGKASHFYRGSQVERAIRGQMISILPQGRFGAGDTYKLIESREAGMPERVIATLPNAWLGAVPVDARPRSPRLASVADAVLYLGPSEWLTVQWPSAYVFQNDEYWAELNRRWKLTQGQPFDLAAAGFDLRGRLGDVSRPISTDPRPQRRRETAQSSPPPNLIPTDAVDFVVKKLDQYPILGLGDEHLCLEFHQFVQKLVRDPRLPGRINDIVVEFGNPRFQDVIDRYVLKGEDVPFEQRKRIWQEAAIGWYVGNSPVYEQFFDTVRQVNRALPQEKRIRVVLGDAPVDLQAFRANPEQYLQEFAGHETAGDPRETSLAASVDKVLAEHHRAIVICGNGHLKMKGRAGNARQIVEGANPSKFFLLDTTGPGHRSWPRQSVVTVADDPEPAHATLWLGPIQDLTGVRPSPLIYRDREYVAAAALLEELTRRRSLLDLADPIFEYRGRYYDRPAVETPDESLPHPQTNGLSEFLLEPAAPGGGHYSKGPGAIAADSISLREMVAYAYDIPEVRVLGPSWLNEKFKVQAKGSGGEQEDFRKVFRDALASRLHLRFEQSDKVLPVSILKVAAPAIFQSRLSPAGGEARMEGTHESVSAANLRMAVLENMLSEAVRRPVINETGSTGPFTFELHWKAGDMKSLIEALRNKLGVELEDARREVPVVTVDRQ